MLELRSVSWLVKCVSFEGSLPQKMVKVGGLGGGLLWVACSGFYVNLKSVVPLIRFLKRVFGELIYRFR